MLKLITFRDNENNTIIANLFTLIAIIQPSPLNPQQGMDKPLVLFPGITSKVSRETIDSILKEVRSLTADLTDEKARPESIS